MKRTKSDVVKIRSKGDLRTGDTDAKLRYRSVPPMRNEVLT